jgi:hypothetical protein
MRWTARLARDVLDGMKECFQPLFHNAKLPYFLIDKRMGPKSYH